MSVDERLKAAMSTRPRFHLTPRYNWMNDPNGLVHVDGVWHAYFQHNPEGIDWGNMSWGHATSTDLARWREHPVALHHRDGEQIYSGSVIAEADGTLTALYTSAYASGIQAQSRALSRDGGETWILDAGNPVLDRGSSDFRDPKVVRVVDEHGVTRWVMVAVEAVERRVLFYASDDLRAWRETGSFGPVGPTGVVWECPDLVRLTLDSDNPGARWVLLLSTNPVGDHSGSADSAMHYIVGSWDGKAFTADRADLIRVDHGSDCYAGVTFDSAPGDAVVMLAWMSNWRYAHVVPSAPWRGAMSLPRKLSLRTIDGEPRLVQWPVPFVDALLRSAATACPSEPLVLAPHALVELRWDPATTGVLRVRLAGERDATVEIVHDPTAGMLTVARAGAAASALHPYFASTSTAPLFDPGAGRLLVSLDGPLLEVFAGGGETALSNLVTLGPAPVTLTLDPAASGTVSVRTIQVDAPIADPAATTSLPSRQTDSGETKGNAEPAAA